MQILLTITMVIFFPLIVLGNAFLAGELMNWIFLKIGYESYPGESNTGVDAATTMARGCLFLLIAGLLILLAGLLSIKFYALAGYILH